MYNVAYVTGFRADYGIVRKYLKNLRREVNLTIIATGALLEEKFGKQVELIYKDEFDRILEIPYELNHSSDASVVESMSNAMKVFGAYFASNKFDLLIILGDRYEMLSIAIAAAMQKIPILHLHGGEATYANYDEFIRHSITKMSNFHITSTEEYRKRVIQMGENPDTVFNLGALGAENCLEIDDKKVISCIKELKKREYCVVLFHPETLSDFPVQKQTEEILSALSTFSELSFVFLGTNADTKSDMIRSRVMDYVNSQDNTYYFENLNTDSFHYLVRESLCIIGNSSSGLIEAPSLGVYSINIGDRQAGRTRGSTVIDVRCEKYQIIDAIFQVKKDLMKIKSDNPYYKKDAAKNYAAKTMDILRKLNNEGINPKIFYNLYE